LFLVGYGVSNLKIEIINKTAPIWLHRRVHFVFIFKGPASILRISLIGGIIKVIKRQYKLLLLNNIQVKTIVIEFLITLSECKLLFYFVLNSLEYILDLHLEPQGILIRFALVSLSVI
jgi:hypothetical protein